MRTLGRDVEEYLNTIPDERAGALSTVRDAIVAALPDDYVEILRDTAIYYEIPRRFGPKGLGKPLIYAGLASQKNYMTVYLRALYYDPDFRTAFIARWEAGGTPLDIAKSCVRFRSLDELDLECVADAIAEYTPAEYVETYTSFRQR